MRKSLLAMFLAASAASGVALAQDASWQRVTLSDGSTIEVPAGADYKPKGDDPDLGGLEVEGERLLQINIHHGAPGDPELVCVLERDPYEKFNLKLADVVAAFQKQSPEPACAAVKDEMGYRLIEMGTPAVGRAARSCTGSYSTDAADHVDHLTLIAGPRHMYDLHCEVEAFIFSGKSVPDAYRNTYRAEILHLEQSLQLPDK